MRWDGMRWDEMNEGEGGKFVEYLGTVCMRVDELDKVRWIYTLSSLFAFLLPFSSVPFSLFPSSLPFFLRVCFEY